MQQMLFRNFQLPEEVGRVRWLWQGNLVFVCFRVQGFGVLYRDFRSLAFLGLLGFLVRQQKI